jgi:hypothetical protein
VVKNPHLVESAPNQMIQRKRFKMSLLKKVPFILVALALLVANSAYLASPAYAAAPMGPVYAKEVVEDQAVTLVGSNLATNTRYDVYLSRYGKYPAKAIRVGFALTDEKGTFTKTFKIPAKLVDIPKIGINLTGRFGDAATNWFINASSTNNTPGEGSPAFSFKVTSIKPGASVKIKTINLPANVSFDVRMGKAGSEGKNGTLVGEMRSSKGGGVSGTYEIPEALQNRSQIDVRMENQSLGIVYYLTIKNK